MNQNKYKNKDSINETSEIEGKINDEIKSVLVTGGAGYVGCVLVPKLLNKGYRVKVLDLYMFGKNVLQDYKDNPLLEQIEGDIRNQQILKETLKNCDSVIHLACISNDPSVDLNHELSRSINYDAIFPLVKSSKKNGVKRFINVSTCSVYGISDAEKVTEDHPLIPITAYNKFKAFSEPIVLEQQSSDFTTCVIRPATICGYSTRLRLDLTVNILTNHAFNTGKITIFGGDQTRPQIHIDDITDLYVSLLELPNEKIGGKIYNTGYENFTINELAQKVKTVIERRFPEREPVEIVKTPSDDVRSYRICSEKIKKELGFAPKKSIEVLDLGPYTLNNRNEIIGIL